MEKTEKKIFKNRIKLLTVFLAFLSVFCAVFLLWNASRTSAQSNAISDIVADNIKDSIEQNGAIPSIFDGTPAINDQSHKTESNNNKVNVNSYHLSIFVRKSAHLLGYTALAFFTTLALISHGKNKDFAFMSGISFGVITAIADETIQSFTDGRTGKVNDVLLDTCGCVMGAFFAIMLIITTLTILNVKVNFKK